MALRVAAEVEAELDEIWSYVATEGGNADVAERLINSITDHFFVLAKHPHLGRRRDYDLRPGLRSISVGAYVIIHRIEGRDVLILHVMHVVAILRRCSVTKIISKVPACPDPYGSLSSSSFYALTLEVP